MKKILFVCLGNICRSSAAEGIMRKMVCERGLSECYEIDSAGCIGYHCGELPDARMRQHASLRGYNLTHRSRPVCTDDFHRFDLVIGMDESNIAHLRSIAPSDDDERKIVKMTDFCKNHETDHVPDPYYGGAEGFERVLDILEDACGGLIDQTA